MHIHAHTCALHAAYTKRTYTVKNNNLTWLSGAEVCVRLWLLSKLNNLNASDVMMMDLVKTAGDDKQLHIPNDQFQIQN